MPRRRVAPPRAPKLSREAAETAAILDETRTLAVVAEAAGVKPDRARTQPGLGPDDLWSALGRATAR